MKADPSQFLRGSTSITTESTRPSSGTPGRPFRHKGNLRYLWGLDRRVRRFLPAGLPYPKFVLVE